MTMISSTNELSRAWTADWYTSHHHWLQNWLVRKVGSKQDAADLTHDTFVKLLHKDNQTTIQEPRAYLVTIAHGLMVNYLRRRDMEKAYIAAAIALGESEEKLFSCPETYALILEKLIQIDQMLIGLPVKVRTAFLMYKLDGLSYAEVAEKMDMSVISIKKYIARALLHCATERG